MSPRLSDVHSRQAKAQQPVMAQSRGRMPAKNEPTSPTCEEVTRWPGGLWLVGVHGGAGVTSLAQAGVGLDGGRRWPQSPVPGVGTPHPVKGPTVPLPPVSGVRSPDAQGVPPGGVLLVARETASGLDTASRAAASVQRNRVPDWLYVLGLVVVAASPNRPARLVRERMQLVPGWFPQLWYVPWVPELLAIDVNQVRYCGPFKAAIPPSLYKLQQLERK